MSADNEKDYIQLDQFLKLKNVVASGGEAKHLIREGLILVNGEVETRRGRKLRSGDQVEFEGQKFVVSL
jgi:ribosome-associated protein